MCQALHNSICGRCCWKAGNRATYASGNRHDSLLGLGVGGVAKFDIWFTWLDGTSGFFVVRFPSWDDEASNRAWRSPRRRGEDSQLANRQYLSHQTPEAGNPRSRPIQFLASCKFDSAAEKVHRHDTRRDRGAKFWISHVKAYLANVR